MKAKGGCDLRVRIRQAHPKEAATLSALSMRSMQSNGYDDAFMEACCKELLITEQHFETRAYWAAEAKGIVGVIGLEPDTDGPSGEVCALFVAPDQKRQGLGRLLWDHLIGQAKAKGLHCVWLDADPAAVPFYEALGLRTVKAVPSRSIAGRVLPQMVFDLGEDPDGHGQTVR
ncbi:MAG: GNAT family N-acetyltransferase [Pelagimonas sp.]|uniref:GNAT family N-acetyltransferase n=1 Tax=Pelagimonas sp. TaxID=2073170 RepID=UPI003D6B26D4